MPFTEKLFLLSNHVPPGGLGCFDATFAPDTGVMKVTVKVCPRLPFYSKLESQLPTLKEQYMKIFREKVPEFWDNRFHITLEKKGFDRIVVKPVFEVVEAALEDAHYDFVMIPNANPGVDVCVRTGEDPQIGKLRGTNFYKPEFDKHSNKLSAQFPNVAFEFEDKSETVIGFLREPLKVAVTQGPKGGNFFSFTTMEALRTHANTINTCFQPSNRTPTVSIDAPTRQLAGEVSGVLSRFGLKAKYKLSAKGLDGVVTIRVDARELDLLLSYVKVNQLRAPQIGQYAVVHEYGHMLGLPDEYICYSEGTIKTLSKKQIGFASKTETEQRILKEKSSKDVTTGQANSQIFFVQLCQQFGVPAPPLNSKNPSLMSAGHQFLPCHGVTLADTLRRMTSKYTTAKDWRVDVVR